MIDMSKVIPGFNRGPQGDPNISQNPNLEQVQNTANPYEDYQMPDPGAFPFPDLWGQAEDFYGNMMGGGMNVGSPWQWGYGSDVLRGMAGSGMPVDIEGWAAANEPVMQRQYEQAAAQALETAGYGGKRWATPTAASIADIGGKIHENFMLDIAGKQMSSQEAARQRQLQATGQLLGYGQAESGLGLANMANMMGAAGAGVGLGGQQLFAPMQIGQGMMQMGGGMQNMQQQEINAMMNDPYLMMALQMSGQMGNQFAPQQFNPGWASQFLDIGGSLLPNLFNQQQTPGTGAIMPGPGGPYGGLRGPSM